MCDIFGTPCTVSEDIKCEEGYLDTNTNTCYSCIYTDNISKNNNNENNTSTDPITVSVTQKPFHSTDIFGIEVKNFGYRACTGTNCSDVTPESVQNLNVYNALDYDATGENENGSEITLTLNNGAGNAVGIHSYKKAYNAAAKLSNAKGTITITNAQGYTFGIYAKKDAYNAYALNNLDAMGIININTGSIGDGYIYGMYSHEGTAYNADGGLGSINIYNTQSIQTSIFGIYNGKMSANNGEGYINITDDIGSSNIYGIYNGNMSGNDDSINISSNKTGSNTQTIVGIHKDNSEKTNGNIVITNTGLTSENDKVVGIEYTGSSKFDASEADLQITGGLYETVGVSSSAPITYAPSIYIYDTLPDFNSIIAVTNQLYNLDNAELTLNDIEITNQNSNFSSITGVQTNNPNIILGEDKLISISSSVSSKQTTIHGILYMNEVGNQKFSLSANGSDVDRNKLNLSVSGTSAMDLQVLGLALGENYSISTSIDKSSNNIPITITSTASKDGTPSFSFAGIMAQYINFTNNGEISATINSGDLYGIGTQIGSLVNTADISLSNNSNNTNDKTRGIAGLDGDNQYTITNSGKLQINGSGDTDGIYADNYSSIINEVGGDISGAKYGISAKNVNTIENKASIEATYRAIYAGITSADPSSQSTITNSGELQINETRGTYGIYANNYSSIINEVGGNISGAEYGIVAYDIKTIENHASITASNTAIYAETSPTNSDHTLTNSGKLTLNGSGETKGIYAKDYLSIINRGEISNAYYGIYAVNNSSQISDAKIENEANITASNTAIYAEKVYQEENTYTLTNSV